MKQVVKFLVANLALFASVVAANSACYFFAYQPDEPACVKRLAK